MIEVGNKSYARAIVVTDLFGSDRAVGYSVLLRSFNCGAAVDAVSNAAFEGYVEKQDSVSERVRACIGMLVQDREKQDVLLTDAEKLAVAVLSGDQDAALALADEVAMNCQCDKVSTTKTIRK